MIVPSAGLAWLVIGVVCFLLEMALPGFVIFFFGVGAWVVALVSWFMPIGLNGQLTLFLFASLLSLFTLRGFIRKIFSGNVTVGGDERIGIEGGRAEVVEDIVPPGEGKIFYSGTHWQAIAEEKIEKGSIVTIVSQSDLCVKVAKTGK